MKNKRQRRKRRKRQLIRRMIISICIVAGVMTAIIGYNYMSNRSMIKRLDNVVVSDMIEQNFIKIDGHSRTGEKLSDVKDIVIHYVGNPGSTAINNRNYFDSEKSNVSSHFVVGLEGEIVQCLPLSEESAASNWRNKDTISIEVCHPDETGKFNKKTYQSLVKLTAWLLKTCELDDEDIIRHYDITGKECPRYFVTHEKAWTQFKKDVKQELNK